MQAAQTTLTIAEDGDRDAVFNVPEIIVAATLTIVAALKNFDIIYMTTRGGPGNATELAPRNTSMSWLPP